MVTSVVLLVSGRPSPSQKVASQTLTPLPIACRSSHSTAHALHCIALRYAASPDRPAEPVNPCANCCFQVVVSTAPNTHVRTSSSWNLEAKLDAFDCCLASGRPGAEHVSKSTTVPGPYGTQALGHFRSASRRRRVVFSPLLSSRPCNMLRAGGRALLFSGNEEAGGARRTCTVRRAAAATQVLLTSASAMCVS